MNTSVICRNHLPLSQPLHKEGNYIWSADCQSSFDSIKLSLAEAPILAIANDGKPFHVVCDASGFAIG